MAGHDTKFGCYSFMDMCRVCCFLVFDERVHLLRVGGSWHPCNNPSCLICVCSNTKYRKLLSVHVYLSYRSLHLRKIFVGKSRFFVVDLACSVDATQIGLSQLHSGLRLVVDCYIRSSIMISISYDHYWTHRRLFIPRWSNFYLDTTPGRINNQSIMIFFVFNFISPSWNLTVGV